MGVEVGWEGKEKVEGRGGKEKWMRRKRGISVFLEGGGTEDTRGKPERV